MLIPLTVTPGSWRPYIESASVTFTAIVTDIPPGTDVSYEWSASDTTSVTISSPHARSTLISCDVPTALGWSGASLSVRASFAGEHLVSRLAFHYGSADPQVSVVFDKDGVIFEDRYEDSPGTWVERRSTNVTLRVFAYGGSEGGTLQLTKSGLHRLHKLSGANLPTTSVAVGAGESVTYDAVYEGVEASSSEYDVSVSAVFTPNGSGDVASAQDSLTVIRLELQAVYEAPENPCTNRHVYGVGEDVRFTVTPALADVSIIAVKGDNWDLQTPHDTFDGHSVVDGSAIRTYTCPIAATYTPHVSVSYGDVMYVPLMTIVEPQLVVTKSATATGWFWPGQVGMGVLHTENFIGPMNVSFQGVRFAEIICTNAIPPEGWFASTNYTGRLSHDYYAGAGHLHSITGGNRWTADDAGRDIPYDNWFAGRMRWKIPIGWVRRLPNGGNQDLAREPNYERHTDESSRPLLIGGSPETYMQVFEIDTEGTASVEKFGYRLERSRWSFTGEVIKCQ